MVRSSSTAFSNRLSVQILRLPTGVDFTHLECEIAGSTVHSTPISINNSEIDLRAAVNQAAAQRPLKRQLMHVDSNLHMDAMLGGSSNNVTLVVPQLRE